MEHEIRIINKTTIIVDEVVSVDSFDGECISLNLKEEGLLIYGKNLHMEGLDVEEGRFYAEGEIEAVTYMKKKNKSGVWGKFRK